MKVTRDFLVKVSGNGYDLLPIQKEFLKNNGYNIEKSWFANLIGTEMSEGIARQLQVFAHNRSIAHEAHRKLLKQALKADEKVYGKKYEFPMTEFRHGLYLVSDNCKGLRNIEFTFDHEKEIMSALLKFDTRLFRCTYDYRAENKDQEVYIEKLEQANESDEDLTVVVANTECKSCDIYKFVKSFEPKKVIIRK